MKTLLRLWCSACLGLVQAAPVSAVRILGDDSYRPVIYIDGQQAKGNLTEVIRQAAQKLDVAIKLDLLPWNRAYTSALNGQGGIVGLSKSEQRLALFDYSDPIFNDDINIVVLKGHEFPFDTLKDLQGKMVGAQLGASYGTEVDAAINLYQLRIERDTSHLARLRKLLAGRLDCAFIGNGNIGLQALLATDPDLRAHKDQFTTLPKPLVHDVLYLGFPKAMNMQSFLKRFNTALREMKQAQLIPDLAP